MKQKRVDSLVILQISSSNQRGDTVLSGIGSDSPAAGAQVQTAGPTLGVNTTASVAQGTGVI